ncbi:MAG: hotdog domain-containing protein [Acidimicrobiales bacterium]|nr:hotdog domain-containing protein [Acidimicrobiales bacterium]
MSETLTVGLEGSGSHEITADMSPPHLPAPVLSTPSMIQLIEATCLTTAQAHLDEGQTTVGTHVCVSHDAGAFVGETIEVGCRLAELDRRRLTFEVTVTCGDRTLSTGTHQRAVVDLSRFG